MRFHAFSAIISYVCLIVSPMLSFAQTDLVNAINSELIPLKTVESSSDFSDLERLKLILKDKRIVALGEATHGTHEFFTFKHRMLEFLVKEMDFKTFAIEADFAGTFAMNDYVVNGKGTALDALEEMAIGVWFTEEFMDMVEWIKQYNSTQTNDNKVRFYGFDMQFAFNSAPALMDGKIKLKQPLSANAQKGLQVIADHRYGPMDKSQLPLLNATVEELKGAVVVESSPEKTKIYQQYISAIIQTIEFSVPKHRYDEDIIRDKYMAENSEWIYRFAGENKMVVWAHNLHIAKDITKNNNLPMGYHLAQKYPADSYAMGFGFNSGSFWAYHTENKKIMTCPVPEVRRKNSSDNIFGQCATKNFIFDFKSAAQVSPLIDEFINKKVISRAIGAQYNPKKEEDGSGSNQKLIKMYDAIIYIRTLDLIENRIGERELDFPVSLLVNTMPKEAHPKPKPSESNKVAYGAYLVNIAGCVSCHSKYEKGAIVKGSEFGGGMEFHQPGGITRTANITPHQETGIGQWTKEYFVQRFKFYSDSSHVPTKLTSRDLNSPMPWYFYSNM